MGCVDEIGDVDVVVEVIVVIELQFIVGCIVFDGVGLLLFVVKNVVKILLVGG